MFSACSGTISLGSIGCLSRWSIRTGGNPAIVVMAHKLGIKVIAERVETTGQRDLLAAVGCEYVQGYLYSKPLPEDEFLTFVAQAY